MEGAFNSSYGIRQGVEFPFAVPEHDEAFVRASVRNVVANGSAKVRE